MALDVFDHGLSYDFENSNKTDNTVINLLTEARNGLMKEIIESFGEDMGNVNLKRNYTTIFDTQSENFKTNNVINFSSHNKYKDDLIHGILRFANAIGLDNFGGDGRWARAVIEMAAWYVRNIHAYSNSSMSLCPLINKNVRWDCSGFVTACLWYYGALKDMVYAPSSAAYTDDEQLLGQLQRAGFEKMQFTWDTVIPFDIITFPGHVEIYNGIDHGKRSSWSWGSCHDEVHGGLPCCTAHQNRGYNIIWRNKYNGTSENYMDGLDIVSPQITSGQTHANGLKVIELLMSSLGLTKEQAAGIVGVMAAESGINPANFNKGERMGTYRSSAANNEGAPYGHKHSPWSYGAGICQWTFTDRKEKAIIGGLNVSRDVAINIIKHGGIESLSLEQQTKMLEYELLTTYRNTLEGIKKCKTARSAAATFYCHAIAGYSTSSMPATQSEINKKNSDYRRVGAQSQINKGMAYAEGFMK